MVFLAALEEPVDCEAELAVFGTEICLCHVMDGSQGNSLVGVLVIVEREQALRPELPVFPIVGQGQVRHLLQSLPVQSVQHLPAEGLAAGQRPVTPDSGYVQIDREEPVAESLSRRGFLNGLPVSGNIHAKAQPVPWQIVHNHIHASFGVKMRVLCLQIPRAAILHERVIKEAVSAVVVRVSLNDKLPWDVIGIYQL